MSHTTFLDIPEGALKEYVKSTLSEMRRYGEITPIRHLSILAGGGTVRVWFVWATRKFNEGEEFWSTLYDGNWDRAELILKDKRSTNKLLYFPSAIVNHLIHKEGCEFEAIKTNLSAGKATGGFNWSQSVLKGKVPDAGE